MGGIAGRVLTLDALDGLELRNVAAEVTLHRGKRAVRLVEGGRGEGEALAVLPLADFGDGTIEAEIAGVPHEDALGYSRGFVGIAFRVQPDRARYECFFLRPTNSRADDQLRRNHSTQYIAEPEYPWHRLRAEQPGVYESYVDLETGAWTRVRIVVAGGRARLYVHDAAQPCLIVNDLKHGVTAGGIALWVGSGTDAYFSRVAVRRGA